MSRLSSRPRAFSLASTSVDRLPPPLRTPLDPPSPSCCPSGILCPWQSGCCRPPAAGSCIDYSKGVRAAVRLTSALTGLASLLHPDPTLAVCSFALRRLLHRLPVTASCAAEAAAQKSHLRQVSTDGATVPLASVSLCCRFSVDCGCSHGTNSGQRTCILTLWDKSYPKKTSHTLVFVLESMRKNGGNTTICDLNCTH